MGDMTYEQFKSWCEHWNYTVDDGFKAMCFVANVLGQNFSNHADAVAKAENDPYHSDAFLSMVKSFRDDAFTLSNLYNKLESNIYVMLEKHDGQEVY